MFEWKGHSDSNNDMPFTIYVIPIHIFFSELKSNQFQYPVLNPNQNNANILNIFLWISPIPIQSQSNWVTYTKLNDETNQIPIPIISIVISIGVGIWYIDNIGLAEYRFRWSSVVSIFYYF